MAPPLNLPAPAHGASDELKPRPPAATVESVAEGDLGDFPSSGIIYPPPDLRAIVDKTAAFVARVGPHFEAKIREQEKHNQKFSFLNAADAYHAYYRAQTHAVAHGGDRSGMPTDAAGAVAAVQEQAEAERVAAGLDDMAEPEEPPEHLFSLAFPSVPAVDLEVLKLTALFTARKGQAFASGVLARESRSYQFEFLRPTHHLFSYFNLLVEQYRRVMQPLATDLDQVRLGAHDPRHGAGRGGARQALLPPIRRRAAWMHYHAQREKEARAEEKRRRAAFDEIDWQDFLVVGVVEITDADERADLPPPQSLYELQRMTAAQQRMNAMIQEEKRREDAAREMEEAAAAELAAAAHAAPSADTEAVIGVERPAGSAQAAAEAPGAPTEKPDTPPAPEPEAEKETGADPASGQALAPAPAPAQALPPAPAPAPASLPHPPRTLPPRPEAIARPSTAQGPVKIRRDYVRTQRTGQSLEQTTVSPISGQAVAVKDMAEHVRVELMNPKFREERQKLEQRKQEQASLAAGVDPSRHLKQFAGARTDIFGARADEEAQAQKETEQRRVARAKEKIIWDGHANSVVSAQDAVARNPAVDERLAQIQRTMKSLAPSGPALGPQARPKRGADGEHADARAAQAPRHDAGAAAPAVPPLAPAPVPGTPAPRRADGALYPEGEWLAMRPYPVNIWVRLPDAQSVSPHCSGRTVPLQQQPLTTTVGSIRDRVLISPLERSVAASKLKMWIHGRPATLRQTLAYWNMADGDMIELTLAK
ncbi:SF3a splicing factor complex subunit [Malassezia sp. CBS 17886]|nr:SF3a splicing factor complex subunit [Malassezia sp. CBS 17886]